mgnify:CR=1 FL=1
MKKILADLKQKTPENPSLQKNINDLSKALDIYNRDCILCKKLSNNDQICLNTAIKKLFRQLPFNKHSIYPWTNYEWDYSSYIDNNYSAKATGSSSRGGWSSIYRNNKIYKKLFDAYIRHPNPQRLSNSRGVNKYSDYPIYGCQGNNLNKCRAIHHIKTSNSDSTPYKSNFFNKKLDGEFSSSYFVKVGTCPRKDITNKKDCESKNHKWISNTAKSSGSCYQNRYMFIDNSPGFKTAHSKFKNKKGFIPSLANDIISLTPDKLYNAFTGKNVKGHMKLQKCDSYAENFKNYQNHKNDNSKFMMILSIVIAIITILFALNAYYLG